MVNDIKIIYPDGTKEICFAPVALLKAGVIPIIVTSLMRHKNYFSSYLKYILDRVLLARADRTDPFNRKKLFLFIDELTDLTSAKNPHQINESIRKAFTTGRMGANMGTTICAQSIYDVDPKILQNIDFYFGFHCGGVDSTILAQYMNLSSKEKKMFGDLQPFEFLAKTNLHFNVTDVLGGRMWQETGVFRCRSLPSLSHHLPPMSLKVDTEWESGEHIQTKNYGCKVIKDNGVKLYQPIIGGGFEGRRLLQINKNQTNIKEYSFDIKPPIVIEGIDYLKTFWQNEGKIIKEMDYSEIRDKGWTICKAFRVVSTSNKHYEYPYFVLRRSEEITNNVVPYLKNPPVGIQIVYNVYTKSIKLRGMLCSKKWYKL